MISVEEADKIISSNVKSFPITEKPLTQCYGSILQQDIKAERNSPPFNKSLLDGIALKMSSYNKGHHKFLIEGMQSAGKPPLKLKFPNSCVEISTGAVLSQGCDCVIPIEQVKIFEGKALVQDKLFLKYMQNIRLEGADHKKGKVLAKKGNILNPPELCVAAAEGKAQLKVSIKPRVAIISSGDELVDVDALIKPYQIRKANNYFMQAALQKSGLFETSMFHFKDDKRVLLTQIKVILENYDVLVLSGGVSMGKFDLIPQVMQELGVKVLFHKVKQKPGKPFWFGISKERKPIFALPGNPISTQIGMYRHVLPHLQKALGMTIKQSCVILKENFKPNTDLVYFLPVKTNFNAKAQLEATPMKTGGSGDYASTAGTDGFIEIPSGMKVVKKGFIGKFYNW